MTALIVATPVRRPSLGAYLAVPIDRRRRAPRPRHHPQRHPASGLDRRAPTVAADRPASDAVASSAAALPWLLIGLGVGLLASWQSRSTRSLVARQAPYAAAHQLMAARAPARELGLPRPRQRRRSPPTSTPPCATATGCARTTVFVVDPDDTLRPLNGGDDVERIAARDRPRRGRAHPRRGRRPAARRPADARLLRARRSPAVDARARRAGARGGRRLRRAPGHRRALRRRTSPRDLGGAQPDRPRDARRRGAGDRRRSATSSTRSSRSATSRAPASWRPTPARRDHPPRLRDPVLHLRPAPRGHRRPPVRRRSPTTPARSATRPG